MIATYRLQLTPDFGFAEARQVIPYLRQLGISHLYLSPITEARAGSTHGYDVVDHNAVRAELGGALQLQLFLGAARQHKLKVILDIVPNHAGIGPQNARWQDVLAYGPHSPYARYFDIEWQPLKPELHHKVLLPFLGGNYGDILEAHEIDVRLEGGRLHAAYYAHRFALNPKTYSAVLTWVLPHVRVTAGVRQALEILQLAFAGWKEPDRATGEELCRQLGTLCGDEAFATAWQLAKKQISVQMMHELLQEQFWRLANWRTAGHEINYRRFFEINDLIGLRMEDPRVFAATHRLVKELLCDEVVAGLRIDHVDGLFDPQSYLERLQTVGARHVWVEKILARDERLSRAWPVDGTTGYEFAADMNAAFSHPHGKKPLLAIYRRFVREMISYRDEVYRSKRLMMVGKLAGELQRLAYELDRLSEADVHFRDFTLQALREALLEMVSSFSRYRTYMPHDAQEAARVIHQAVHQAAERNLAIDPSIYEFIGKMLLSAAHAKPAHAAWVGRFQQYTAPVTAKGVEDTAFYRYNCLVALNEVGGLPTEFGLSTTAFHDNAQDRARNFPRNLLATSTHDTKRGEDLRMRLVVLSEMPEVWRLATQRLRDISAPYITPHGPSRHDVYLLWQTLAALWSEKHDDLCARLQAAMQKSAREAKRNTSWTNPNAAYEDSLRQFVKSMLADLNVDETLGPINKTLVYYGLLNSLGQLILKNTSPGVPDFYRGCEYLDLSLVDPDNRRSVDFSGREQQLNETAALVMQPYVAAVQALLGGNPNHAKLFMTARLLRLRAMYSELRASHYSPLQVHGKASEHVLAYQRGELAVIVPRYQLTLKQAFGWGDTWVDLPEALKRRTCQELLSGGTLQVKDRLEPGLLPLPWGILRVQG